MEQLGADLRNGVRALRRGRGVAAMAVLTLALGIGANAAIFSVAHAFLPRVWQVRDPQTLTFVRARASDGDLIDDFAWPIVERLRMPMRSLSELAAYDGSTRTREIGVRIALGAQTRDVTGMILREAGTLVLAGIVIGVPGAWAAAQLVGSFLYGVAPSNPALTVACCAVVGGVAALAAFVPARRAAQIDPLVALQRE